MARGAFGGAHPLGDAEIPGDRCGVRKTQNDRARWNNVLAPVLLPLVSAPLGPLNYCMITATKR